MFQLDLSSRPDPGPHLRVTWFSVTNVLIEHAGTRILFDGYVSRLPRSLFHGGPSGYAFTSQPSRPDVARVSAVAEALCPDGLDLIITGHSHFDHSFDVGAWQQVTGAHVLGSRSTCLQAIAQGVPMEACTVVEGGEVIDVSQGLRCRVVRWNHSGNDHDRADLRIPLEIRHPPDARAGLRAGVFEDFPNGGGSRGYLFEAAGADATTSLLVTNTGCADDLDKPVVCEDRDFGAPAANLAAAMTAAGVDRVDVWAGMANPHLVAAGGAVAAPRHLIPMHWDGIFHPFETGAPHPFDRPETAAACAAIDTLLVDVAQYFDAWDFDSGELIAAHTGHDVFVPAGEPTRR